MAAAWRGRCRLTIGDSIQTYSDKEASGKVRRLGQANGSDEQAELALVGIVRVLFLGHEGRVHDEPDREPPAGYAGHVEPAPHAPVGSSRARSGTRFASIRARVRPEGWYRLRSRNSAPSPPRRSSSTVATARVQRPLPSGQLSRRQKPDWSSGRSSSISPGVRGRFAQEGRRRPRNAAAPATGPAPPGGGTPPASGDPPPPDRAPGRTVVHEDADLHLSSRDARHVQAPAPGGRSARRSA